MAEVIRRCVNLDWVEIYVLESRDRYPCNADYYRQHGYIVYERDYGTRQYKEMFTIEDEHGEPWIEVRRNPASGASGFSGFVAESSHLRLVNRQCYSDSAISRLRDFLLLHEYIWKRIYRLDICYDFEKFDSGDRPDRFCQRYVSRKYSKINQCSLSAHAQDNWSTFDWETLSWGSRTSMVSTKIYNKSKELAANKTDKPYIKWVWYENGLIDSPTTMEKRAKDGTVYKPDIWRIEFSLKSAADNWLIIEDTSGKRVKKRAIPHRLSLFDSKDKLWARFQDLAYHYFRFKIYEEGVRKDRCKDKCLFRWDANHEFTKIQSLPSDSKPSRNDDVLRRRLIVYRSVHADIDIRKACDILLKEIDKAELSRIAPRDAYLQAESLRKTIALKMGRPYEDSAVILDKIRSMLFNDEIF